MKKVIAFFKKFCYDNNVLYYGLIVYPFVCIVPIHNTTDTELVPRERANIPISPCVRTPPVRRTNFFFERKSETNA